MISLRVALDNGLRAFSEALAVRHREEGVSPRILVCTIGDSEQAKKSLTAFHAWRWLSPREASDLPYRLADLGELSGAICLSSEEAMEAARIYPCCLAASGRRVSEAGIDVVGVAVENLFDDPLLETERLRLAEIKHTVGSKMGSPLSSLAKDVAKTGFERLRDSLRLLQMKLEDEGTLDFPERVSLFLDGHADLTLGILVDPSLIDGEDCGRRGSARFAGATTPSKVPVTRFLVMEIRELERWVKASL